MSNNRMGVLRMPGGGEVVIQYNGFFIHILRLDPLSRDKQRHRTPDGMIYSQEPPTIRVRVHSNGSGWNVLNPLDSRGFSESFIRWDPTEKYDERMTPHVFTDPSLWKKRIVRDDERRKALKMLQRANSDIKRLKEGKNPIRHSSDVKAVSLDDLSSALNL